MRGMWVVHVVRVLCLGCEKLVEYVRCVCVWLGAAWVEMG